MRMCVSERERERERRELCMCMYTSPVNNADRPKSLTFSTPFESKRRFSGCVCIRIYTYKYTYIHTHSDVYTHIQ